jgi:hypothetical protein
MVSSFHGVQKTENEDSDGEIQRREQRGGALKLLRTPNATDMDALNHTTAVARWARTRLSTNDWGGCATIHMCKTVHPVSEFSIAVP